MCDSDSDRDFYAKPSERAVEITIDSNKIIRVTPTIIMRSEITN